MPIFNRRAKTNRSVRFTDVVARSLKYKADYYATQNLAPTTLPLLSFKDRSFYAAA